MAGRAIKRTMTVLHIDGVIAIVFVVLSVGKSFLHDTPLMSVLFIALIGMAVFGFIEFLVYGLKMERRFAWLLTMAYLPAHILPVIMISTGGEQNPLVSLPYGIWLVRILVGYYIVSTIYGYMGLLSPQTFRIFFSRSGKIEKDTL